MLGRIIPGRLPSTVADIKLLDQRIAFNKRQLTLLSQRVAQGLMSEQEAAYRRLYLQGENEQLEQTKRSRRYSTPSYRTPLDVFESTRRGGAAKKYVSESQDDGLPAGYFGDDNGRNGGSIPSDWNADDPVDFDVPEVKQPPSPKPVVTWPAGWPGNHSPQITQLLVGMGKVGNNQLYNPTNSLYIHQGYDLVHPGVRASFVQILARYKMFKQTVDSNPSFTSTDKVLMSKIITNMSQQIQDGEAEYEKLNAQRIAIEEQNRINNQSNSESDTNSGDESIPVDNQGTRDLLMYIDQEQSRLRSLYGREGERTKKAFNNLRHVVKTALLTKGNWLTSPGVVSIIKVALTKGIMLDIKLRENPDPFGLDKTFWKAQQEAEAEAAKRAEEEAKANIVSYKMPNPNTMVVYVGQPRKMLFNFNVRSKAQGRWPAQKYFWEAKINYAAGAKRTKNLGKAPPSGTKPKPPKGTMLRLANELLAELDKPATLRGLQGIKGFRKTGNLMGLGAMQAHDRASVMVRENGMTPAQRASYLQAEREMTMARKRAGAKVDLTKQIREEPVTRPWQLQVTVPSASLQAISTLLEQELARANLSQEMFTQQLHTHIASTINSLPSGLRPRQQAEIILEAVMSKTTNASGLLKKDVKVDINRGATSPLTFEASDSISGVVGSLSGTRAALGRLLR